MAKEQILTPLEKIYNNLNSFWKYGKNLLLLKIITKLKFKLIDSLIEKELL